MNAETKEQQAQPSWRRRLLKTAAQLLFIGLVIYGILWLNRGGEALRQACQGIQPGSSRDSVASLAEENGFGVGSDAKDPDLIGLYDPHAVHRDYCLVDVKDGKVVTAEFRPAP